MYQNQAADAWASAQDAAKAIIEERGMEIGTVLSPLADPDDELSVEVECGEQVADELEKILRRDGLRGVTTEDGLVVAEWLIVHRSHGEWVVEDPDGGFWRPSEDAAMEIDAEQDARTMCAQTPMRGEWKQ